VCTSSPLLLLLLLFLAPKLLVALKDHVSPCGTPLPRCRVVSFEEAQQVVHGGDHVRWTGLIITLLWSVTREESVVDSIVLDTDINDIVDSLIESIQAAASWDGKASMCGFDLEIALLGFVSSGYGKGMMLN